MAESLFCVEAAFCNDSVYVGMKALGILLRTGRPGLTHQ
jgi:hypothetical protein